MHMHAAIFVYVRAAETAPGLAPQTQLKHDCVRP